MSGQKSRVRLTAGRVADFACPYGKSQAFLWDTDTPALALRVTPTGRKTYVFESRLHGSTIRVNIGTAAEWSLEAARTKAQGLKMMVDCGTDPREVERQQQAAQAAQKAAAVVKAVAVEKAWTAYMMTVASIGATATTKTMKSWPVLAARLPTVAPAAVA